LTLISDQSMGTQHRSHIFQNLLKIAVFFTPHWATVYNDKGEIWYRSLQSVSTLACDVWP